MAASCKYPQFIALQNVNLQLDFDRRLVETEGILGCTFCLQRLRDLVDGKVREFERLAKEKNWAKLAERYQDNCHVLLPGRGGHVGKTGIADALQQLFVGRKWDGVKLEVSDVDTSGDLVVATGTFIAVGPDGKQATEGKYVFVWKKIGEDLKLKYDIMNLNSA